MGLAAGFGCSGVGSPCLQTSAWTSGWQLIPTPATPSLPLPTSGCFSTLNGSCLCADDGSDPCTQMLPCAGIAFGGVICVGNKPTACVWTNNLWGGVACPPQGTPGSIGCRTGRACVEKCIALHERQHFPQVDCSSCPSGYICRPPFAPHATPNGVGGGDYATLECPALCAELNCELDCLAECKESFGPSGPNFEACRRAVERAALQSCVIANVKCKHLCPQLADECRHIWPEVDRQLPHRGGPGRP